MTHLPYVAASYGLALLVGVAFAADAWLRMRRAARRLEARGEGLFADAVADFDDARSALHCSYRRGRCSFRLVATLERLLQVRLQQACSCID
jgi:hypothetical protein